MTSSGTHVQHGWCSWSTVAIDRLPVLGLSFDGCNTQVSFLDLSTDVGVHAFIFSRNQSEIWTHENEWSRTTPVRSRSENWPKFRKTPPFYSAAFVLFGLRRSSFLLSSCRFFVKKMRNSRSFTYAALFPLVRRLVTRSVRESMRPIGTGRIGRVVELGWPSFIRNMACGVTICDVKMATSAGALSSENCDVEFSEGAIKSKTFPVYNAG